MNDKTRKEKREDIGLRLELRTIMAGEKGGDYLAGFTEGFKVALTSASLLVLDVSDDHDDAVVRDVLAQVNAQILLALALTIERTP